MQLGNPCRYIVHCHFQQAGRFGQEVRGWNQIQRFRHLVQEQAERCTEHLQMQVFLGLSTSRLALTGNTMIIDIQQKFTAIHKDLSPTHRPLFSHITSAVSDWQASSILLIRSAFVSSRCKSAGTHCYFQSVRSC